MQSALITAVITHGTGVALEVGLAAAGIGLGTIAARAGHLPALTPDGNLCAPQAA
jgi:hypothetical protein